MKRPASPPPTAPGGGPVREDDMFNGEVFDGGLARRLSGWDTPGFEPAKLEQYFGEQARAPVHAPFVAAALSAALVPPTLKSVPQAPISARHVSIVASYSSETCALKKQE